jgi:hypothetical protein
MDYLRLTEYDRLISDAVDHTCGEGLDRSLLVAEETRPGKNGSCPADTSRTRVLTVTQAPDTMHLMLAILAMGCFC